MEIVVTHNSMDFDSLAAQFAVTLLHPTARMVLGYPLVGNVRSFLSLYRSSLPIVQIKYLDFERITKVYVVDCQDMDRLDDGVKRLITEPRSALQPVPVTVFDHHQLNQSSQLMAIAQSDSIIESVGAATTILVDKIRKAKLTLTPFEATLLAVGIYEDTGCLTYSGTTEKDAACVGYLLKHGADLLRVSEYIRPRFNDAQVKLLEDLVKNSKSLTVSGSRVVIAGAEMPKFLDGLATMTRKLIELESVDAAFTAVLMRDRTHVVGRSDTASIDVRHIVRHFGGDGHRGAGSAVVKGTDVQLVLAQIEERIRTQAHPEPVASEIMTSPVRTILPSVSMDEASRIMLRYGLDGLIVVEDKQIAGVVSRRDIDQASHHKLGHAPVLGFMSRPVITISTETPLSEVQQILVKEDIGRVPVLDGDGNLVGLVSRHDVLKTMYGTNMPDEILEPEEKSHTYTREPVQHVEFKERMEHLEPPTKWMCEQIGRHAAALNMVAYSVGGIVRDMLLGLQNFDLDFVIEGSAAQVAESLEAAFPGRLQIVAKHDRFQTATLSYFADKKREVDISTARIEFYEFPAALPTVEASGLEQDLLRRDFTINALAVCLKPGEYGTLIDHFGGLNDLSTKKIRILHKFSFIEDPTRIIRAARFAARLGFTLEEMTREQARRAISMGIFDDLGGTRIRTELRLILESPHRIKALDLLGDLGGRLRYLDSELEYGLQVRKLIRRAERLLTRYSVNEPWVVYLGLLLSELPEGRLPLVLDRLHLSNDQKASVQKGIEIPQSFPDKIGLLKKSEIYHLLNGKPPEALAIAACLAPGGTSLRRMIRVYLEELQDIRVELSGGDLLKLGFKEGPEIGRTLGKVLDAKLDGLVNTKDDEIKFVKVTP